MIYVRAYAMTGERGKRYEGDAAVNEQALTTSLALYWRSGKRGQLLLLSDKPVGAKRRRQVLRKRDSGVSVVSPTTSEGI